MTPPPAIHTSTPIPAIPVSLGNVVTSASSSDHPSTRTIPAATLRRLLLATLNVVTPPSDLPAPLNAVLLAQAADGSWTAATTDAVSLATITLQPEPMPASPSPNAPVNANVNPDPANTDRTPVIWMLYPDDAETLLAILTAAAPADLIDPIHVTTADPPHDTRATRSPSLTVHLTRHGIPFTVRLIPNLTGYPDWRRLPAPMPSAATSAALPIQPLSAALTTLRRRPRTVSLTLHPPALLSARSVGQNPVAASQEAPPRAAPTDAILAVAPGDAPSGPPERVAITMTALPATTPLPIPLGHYDTDRLLAILLAAAAILPAIDSVTIVQNLSRSPDTLPTSPLRLSVTDPATGASALWLLAPCTPTQAA